MGHVLGVCFKNMSVTICHSRRLHSLALVLLINNYLLIVKKNQIMPPNIHFIMEPMESCDSCNTSNLLFSAKSWHHLIMSGHDTCIHLMTSLGHATMYGYKFVQETISIPFHGVTCILKLIPLPPLDLLKEEKSVFTKGRDSSCIGGLD